MKKKKKPRVASVKPQQKQSGEPYRLPASLEGAFAVIIAQNALLLSKPIIDIAMNSKIIFVHVLVMSFALINCFIVITNWAACKIFYYSNAVLFCNDIITLALIATVTNIVSGMFVDNLHTFNEKFFICYRVSTIY